MRFHRPRPLTTRPRVSVVIPCYRYGHYLPAAVASALDQSGVDVEVIIVDDASPDDSAATARMLAAQDERITVLVHEQNAGHIATYNDGLALATGDYVTLVSADDLLTRDSLTRAVGLMEHHPRVGFVYGYARSFADEPEESTGRVRNWSTYPGRQWLSLAARRGRCFISSPEAVMRREALAQTDLYDPRLPHSGDFDMWLRTAARWDVGRINGPVQAHYRVHEANMHLTTYAGWLTDLVARRLTFQILFDERARDLPDVQALRPVATGPWPGRPAAGAWRGAVRRRRGGGRGLPGVRRRDPPGRAHPRLAAAASGEAGRAGARAGHPPPAVAARAEVRHVTATVEPRAAQSPPSETPDQGSRIARGLGWSVVANAGLRIGNLLVSMLMARLIAPEQFGVFAVALTVWTILGALAEFGLGSDLVRADDLERRAPTVGSLALGISAPARGVDGRGRGPDRGQLPQPGRRRA